MAAVRATVFWLVSFMISAEALEIITADLGQDVILRSNSPSNNIIITAVEWSRPEQEPEYVLFFRDKRFHPDNQHPSYQNRVDLQDKDMKDGDFSLILKNVTKNDTGRYECRVFQRRKNEVINVIILEVHLSGNKEGITEDRGEKHGGDKDGGDKDGGDKDGVIVGSVVGVILLLLLAVVSVGFLIYRRLMNKNPNLKLPPDDPAAEQMVQNKDMKVFS